MEWTKEKLIETLKYIIQSSESKEIAFEETDKLFYNVLSRDDLVNILIDFIAEDIVYEKIVKSLRKKVNIATKIMGEELKAWI